MYVLVCVYTYVYDCLYFCICICIYTNVYVYIWMVLFLSKLCLFFFFLTFLNENFQQCTKVKCSKVYTSASAFFSRSICEIIDIVIYIYIQCLFVFLSFRLIPKKLMSSYAGMEECQKTNTTTKRKM